MKRVVLCSSSATTRPQRRAGLGHLDDGVGQPGGLDLGGAPAELDLGRDAVPGQPAARQVDHLRGDPLAFQVADRLHRRVVGHGQHPADRPLADLAEDQLRQLDDLRIVLQHPVVAGQAAVERAVLDVARHLLGADQRAVDVRVVDGRVVAAAGVGDLVAGLAEQLAGRLLQTARRDAKFEDALAHFL
jgi:hypothetical protein